MLARLGPLLGPNKSCENGPGGRRRTRQAPGDLRRGEATSNTNKLTRPSRYSVEDFARQRRHLQENGSVVRLSAVDEPLHFVAQEIASEGRPSRSRRAVAVEPDEGKQISRCLLVREAVGQLYRKGQLNVDYWICRRCAYPNHPDSSACRGYVDLPTARWSQEIRHGMENFARMGEPQLRRQDIRVSNASSYPRGRPVDAPRFDVVKWGNPYLPIMQKDGHWVIPCDGTLDTTYGGELLDTSGGGGLTKTSSFFASVFAQDSESREALKDYVDADVIRIVIDAMASETGVVADRLMIAQRRWENLLLAAGSAEGTQKREYTVQANSL